jgi:hypothetical protein
MSQLFWFIEGEGKGLDLVAKEIFTMKGVGQRNNGLSIFN